MEERILHFMPVKEEQTGTEQAVEDSMAKEVAEVDMGQTVAEVTVTTLLVTAVEELPIIFWLSMKQTCIKILIRQQNLTMEVLQEEEEEMEKESSRIGATLMEWE